MFSRFSLALLVLGTAMASAAEPLGFTETLRLAEQQSPELAAQSSGVEAARLTAIVAGSLPDPKLLFGVDNLPATGPDRWRVDRDFMTMRRIGLMQDFPNRARRRAQKAAADAAVDQAQAERRTRVAAVRTGAALAWLDRHYVEQRIELLEDLGRENRLFAATVNAALAGGRGLPADIVGPQQEAADLADRIDALHADDLKARTALRQLIGADGDAPLAAEVPGFPIDAVELRAHLGRHPELASYEPRLAQALAELHEAEAARKPDWGAEVAYARRAAAYDDMVSVQFTLSLPLFSGSRQNPAIGARRLQLRQLESARELLLREHTAALDSELADLALIDRQLARVQQTRLPLARQKVEYQLASYQGGKADLAAVLTARRELIELRLLQLELRGRRDMTAARIHFSYTEPAS